MDYNKESLKIHEQKKGKLAVQSKIPVNNKTDLSIAYTPGVAEPCRKINENKEDVYKYTIKSHMIAVVTDGSAVLGLGNIGPEASIPVMEGKCVLFKEFADVDAFPIALDTQDTEEIIDAVKKIAPIFGGINLEDISAPRCFEIERRLKEELDIPIFHDDQHGTAIVTFAGMINALKLVDKNIEDIKIVVNGAGAAGIAVTKILLDSKAQEIIVCDSRGPIYEGRTENMNFAKEEIARVTNKQKVKGELSDAMKDADVFIGISVAGVVTKEMVRSMKEQPIIFAMANPDPEITPEEAKEAGAYIIATGRSDYPNQINNVLAFPGVMKGLLKIRNQITGNMKIAAAKAIANSIKPNVDEIMPSPFDKSIPDKVARAMEEFE